MPISFHAFLVRATMGLITKKQIVVALLKIEHRCSTRWIGFFYGFLIVLIDDVYKPLHDDLND